MNAHQPDLNLCSRAARGAAGVPSAVVPSTPSPRHRPPALRSLGEGRRRRDGATGTTGTVLLLVTTARSIMPAEGSKRIGCTLPGAHRCARSEPARGSAKLLTARISARPDFPFSRLISRLDCAQLRTGSAVRMGPTAACRAHNRRAVGTSKKRLRRERQALLRAPSTRHPAGHELPSAAFLRAALRTFRPDQEAELVSILRTRSAQIGVLPTTINVQLGRQIGSQKEGLEGDEGGWQDKRNQGALFVSPCPIITWRNL